MKNNFKKILSVLLTACMLLGTMAAMFPMTVGAADAEPIYLEKNTTKTYNGITYRFDTNKADDADSWVRVNPDGTWEINIRNGDMLWFPDIKMTATSEVYAEVTNTDNEPMNYFSGMAYGVTSSTNSAWTSANVAVLKTQQHDKVRLRATPATPSALKGVSGNDYGNGGASPRMFDNNSIAINSAWNSVANTNNKNWDAGKTVYFKVSQTAEKVLLEFGAPGVGAFVDSGVTSYSQGVSGSYSIAGGSVGYTLVWQSNDTSHSQFKIGKMTITNCEVGGVAKDTYTVFDKNAEPEYELPELPEGAVYLEKNKTATYKGITYRFDTNKENDPQSWVRVNADGSWEINIRNGDMLWFPDVELTDTSEIYLEITKTGTNTSDYFPGLAYGVTSSTDSTWTSTNVSVLRTYQNQKMRFRATSITRANAIKVSGSDYGNGGDARPFNNEFAATALWDLIANPENKNWNIGATVYHKVSQTADNVVLEYGVPGYGAFVDPANTSYANNYSGMYAVAGGSVGYTMVWQGNDTAHSQFRIEDITITNCKVGGADKASYSVKAIDYAASDAKISLSLDGTIGLNFSVNAVLPKDATIVVTKNGEVIANQAVVNGENVVTAPVNAKEMGDSINFSIMVDGEVFDEQSYTTSVKAYADTMLASNDYADWHDLIRAMLNYGASAQKVLNYKTDALVADISALDFDLSSIGSISVSGNTSNLAGLFATLTMESDTALNLFFKTIDGSALTATVNGEAIDMVATEDGFLRLTIADIAADELSNEFVIVVNGETSITISATQWAKLVVDGEESAEMKTLAKALAAYADAAQKKNK